LVAAFAVALFFASPVIGALIYAVGARLSNRVLRAVGAAVAIGGLPVAVAIFAISNGD
jgi:hypothetical protein